MQDNFVSASDIMKSSTQPRLKGQARVTDRFVKYPYPTGATKTNYKREYMQA